MRKLLSDQHVLPNYHNVVAQKAQHSQSASIYSRHWRPEESRCIDSATSSQSYQSHYNRYLNNLQNNQGATLHSAQGSPNVNSQPEHCFQSNTIPFTSRKASGFVPRSSSLPTSNRRDPYHCTDNFQTEEEYLLKTYGRIPDNPEPIKSFPANYSHPYPGREPINFPKEEAILAQNVFARHVEIQAELERKFREAQRQEQLKYQQELLQKQIQGNYQQNSLGRETINMSAELTNEIERTIRDQERQAKLEYSRALQRQIEEQKSRNSNYENDRRQPPRTPEIERSIKQAERQTQLKYQEELQNQIAEQKMKRLQNDMEYGGENLQQELLKTQRDINSLRGSGGQVKRAVTPDDPPWLRGNPQPKSGIRGAPVSYVPTVKQPLIIWGYSDNKAYHLITDSHNQPRPARYLNRPHHFPLPTTLAHSLPLLRCKIRTSEIQLEVPLQLRMQLALGRNNKGWAKSCS